MNLKSKHNYIWMVISYLTFMILYNLSNYYASRLGSVPSIYFEWENQIPFIPIMIIPYFSSGIFFAMIFLMCEKNDETYLLAKRVIFITIISVICFFIYPLSFSFEKPPVSNGFLNFFFDSLSTFDKKYNQCPSLHISYCFVYWSVFQNKVKGVLKYLTGFWLLLLAVSTLTVYQHHYIDILGGTFVTIVAFCLFPERENKRRKQNISVASIYYILSFILFSLATTVSGLSLILLYPALSCFFVGVAYFHNNPFFVNKRNGKIPLISWIIYGPYLFAYFIILKFFNKNKKSCTEIIPGLYTGNRLNTEDAKKIITKDMAVIDLTPEVTENRLCYQSEYYYFPFLDICTPPAGDL